MRRETQSADRVSAVKTLDDAVMTGAALRSVVPDSFATPCTGARQTTDGDCSHEIKKRLLLGRKVMTNLDCILKSRDVTLPAKVHLVTATVFPVVMYGCEI